VNDESKSNITSQQISLPPGYIPREKREKRLIEWAIDHGKDPDEFMTITEKDKSLSREYRDRMQKIIDFARDQNLDPEELMDMSRRERLISEEIYLREWEDEGTLRSYVYNDEEWVKNIAILQENGYLW